VQAPIANCVFVPIMADFDKAALEGAIADMPDSERPVRRSVAKNRIVSEAKQCQWPLPSRARITCGARVAALVLAPYAIAMAYAGGLFWTALVTLVAIGLFLEWLTVVSAARAIRVTVSGSVALAIAGWSWRQARSTYHSQHSS